MTTELLLPITVPTNRTRLEVWKERHGVFTWNCTIPIEDDQPFHWEALCNRNNPEHLKGLGHDEEEACFALAEKLRLPWLESIAQKDLMP